MNNYFIKWTLIFDYIFISYFIFMLIYYILQTRKENLLVNKKALINFLLINVSGIVINFISMILIITLSPVFKIKSEIYLEIFNYFSIFIWTSSIFLIIKSLFFIKLNQISFLKIIDNKEIYTIYSEKHISKLQLITIGNKQYYLDSKKLYRFKDEHLKNNKQLSIFSHDESQKDSYIVDNAYFILKNRWYLYLMFSQLMKLLIKIINFCIFGLLIGSFISQKLFTFKLWNIDGLESSVNASNINIILLYFAICFEILNIVFIGINIYIYFKNEYKVDITNNILNLLFSSIILAILIMWLATIYMLVPYVMLNNTPKSNLLKMMHTWIFIDYTQGFGYIAISTCVAYLFHTIVWVSQNSKQLWIKRK
ncbi:hypothetical protein [Spiroplasma culicicola]|uniref:Transmembrane protein n=1 Tax=Spiroplasma culicicola AES-1 TaxID=1276246 RepID=W6A8I2_9MOLU|nr:hypothetical protein [Spiroplasma culicicola]AHI53322.1 hypothetical protein SCULI_v1c09820 [Spiroplasma culicicola AES-1]